MDGNPYATLAALARGMDPETGESCASTQAGLGSIQVRMRLGRVVSAAPLTVNVAGLIQPPSALRVNERLVKGAKWKTKTTSPNSDYRGLSGAVTGQVHSTDTVIDKATVEQLELDLEAEDEVLLLTQDDQVFYIIMKVARAV